MVFRFFFDQKIYGGHNNVHVFLPKLNSCMTGDSYYYALDPDFMKGNESREKVFLNMENMLIGWCRSVENLEEGGVAFLTYGYFDEEIDFLWVKQVSNDVLLIDCGYTQKYSGLDFVPSEAHTLKLSEEEYELDGNSFSCTKSDLIADIKSSIEELIESIPENIQMSIQVWVDYKNRNTENDFHLFLPRINLHVISGTRYYSPVPRFLKGDSSTQKVVFNIHEMLTAWCNSIESLKEGDVVFLPFQYSAESIWFLWVKQVSDGTLLVDSGRTLQPKMLGADPVSMKTLQLESDEYRLDDNPFKCKKSEFLSNIKFSIKKITKSMPNAKFSIKKILDPILLFFKN